MKVKTVKWYPFNNELPRWFIDSSIIDVSDERFFEMIRELYDQDFCVFIHKQKDYTLLCVDVTSFKMR